MEIKDLGGLSEPMKKLIEVVAQGIGGWAKPWQIKRLANAKAYEIETVTRALRNNSDTLNLLEYDGEKVKLLCEQRGFSPEAAQELIALNERTVSRLTHRELRRQENIEKAVSYAIDELLQVEHVSAEPVDEDWITRFFNIAEEVSNEDMQKLWGRILAGEVKQPKSYSLRTLETLKNISMEEAEVFRKVGQYAIPLIDQSNVFIFKDRGWLTKKMRATDMEISLLRDIGLLSVDEDSEVSISSFLSEEAKEYAMFGTLRMDIIYFTKTGKELLCLANRDIGFDEIIKVLFEEYGDTIRSNSSRHILMNTKLGR
ncbi:DUF2806 domain-containing protein [Desulfobulbus sp. F4]|nr:DUF2806 domain-containing protein [Desulfobulbus sp. F4]